VAVEYLFVGATFTFVISLTFNVLGWESDFPYNLMYTLFGGIATFLCGWLLLASDVAMMEAVMYLFWGVGLIDFCLVLLMGINALSIYRKKQRGLE